MKKTRERYKLMKMMKKNHGTAIILSLVIVSVLFIFTSFLVRKVVTNTTMVEKTGEERESYALAKQGILYALDKLNTWNGTDPNYDPTDWTPNEIEQGNWSDYSNYSLMVYKDHIPTSSGYIEKEGYITIESRDLPKKLVTLQVIAENTSPLLEYVRFMNSDVRFSSNTTFGDANSGALFHINGDLILDGDDNEIYLEDDQSFEVAGEITSYDSGSAQTDKVKILPANGASFSSKTLDDDGSGTDGYGFTGTIVNGEYSQLDPEAFNTVQGHYFDGAHLPSSYDYSEDPDNPQYVTGKSIILWPRINGERYENLADLLISASDCGNRSPAWNDWYPSDAKYAGSYVSGDYWRQEGSGDSYNYTPPGVHLILSATQDLDPSTPTTTENLLRINDSSATDTPSEYESIATASSFSGDVIFTEKDIRLNGVLPRSLTIASGGNIYIDSNIHTNGHSLALLAKQNVLLNTTHRWVVGSEGSNWTDAGNLMGVTNGGVARAQVNIGESKEQILNFGGSTSRQIVTTDRIILRGCSYSVGQYNTLNLAVEVDLGGANWQSLTITSGPTFPINGPASNSGLTIVLETPSAFRNLSRIRLTATGVGTGEDPAGWIQVDAVEIPNRDMDRTAIFAENGSWYVIAGNGATVNNNQQEPFTLNVAISQEELEEMTKWTDGSGKEADWDQITYVYDSDLVTTPPPALPPSVNLVSLKRK